MIDDSAFKAKKTPELALSGAYSQDLSKYFRTSFVLTTICPIVVNVCITSYKCILFCNTACGFFYIAAA
jgi:hypothetical protein